MASKYAVKNGGSQTARTVASEKTKEETDQEREERDKRRRKRWKIITYGAYTLLAIVGICLNWTVALVQLWGLSFPVNFFVVPLLGYGIRRGIRRAIKVRKWKVESASRERIANHSWTTHICTALFCVVVGFPLTITVGQWDASRRLRRIDAVVVSQSSASNTEDSAEKLSPYIVDCTSASTSSQRHVSCNDWNDRADWIEWVDWQPDLSQVTVTSFRRQGSDVRQTYCIAPLKYVGSRFSSNAGGCGGALRPYPAFAGCIDYTPRGDKCTEKRLEECRWKNPPSGSSTSRVIAGRFSFYEPFYDRQIKLGFKGTIDAYYAQRNQTRPRSIMKTRTTPDGLVLEEDEMIECKYEPILLEWLPTRTPDWFTDQTNSLVVSLCVQSGFQVLLWCGLAVLAWSFWETTLLAKLEAKYDKVVEKLSPHVKKVKAKVVDPAVAKLSKAKTKAAAKVPKFLKRKKKGTTPQKK
eukprot:TRINITY_DN75854_c0_g1_i1.p1 TRINITY_DN75854_c0_g1~~TRINITY_DN75854_c0_g1_i1.p1  ORF type:complete len:467 (-),score=40.62 TRINITY_DN75854_c0_g1_i1:9-1409(-)